MSANPSSAPWSRAIAVSRSGRLLAGRYCGRLRSHPCRPTSTTPASTGKTSRASGNPSRRSWSTTAREVRQKACSRAASFGQTATVKSPAQKAPSRSNPEPKCLSSPPGRPTPSSSSCSAFARKATGGSFALKAAASSTQKAAASATSSTCLFASSPLASLPSPSRATQEGGVRCSAPRQRKFKRHQLCRQSVYLFHQPITRRRPQITASCPRLFPPPPPLS